MILHLTSPQLPKGKNTKDRLCFDSSHTTCSYSALVFQTEKWESNSWWFKGPGENIYMFVHHKISSRLTTSLGRLLKSLNGDSKVFVSTFNITTSSNDLFFTLCLKNTIINKHLSMFSFQSYNELRYGQKIILIHYP